MTTRNTFAATAAYALLGRMTAAERVTGRFMRGPDDHPPAPQKTVAELASETKALFDRKHDEVKAIAEKALAEANKGIPLSNTAKELADQALTGLNETKARLDELEQKAARKGAPEDQRQPSIGEQYVNSDEFKAAFANGARQGQNVGIEVKTITSLTTDAAGSAGAFVRPQRVQSPMQSLPDRQLTIRSLVAPGQTSSSSIEYVQETGFTNNAGMVAEGTLKPQSDLKYGLKNAPVRKIAHWFLASAEILADAPGLRSMIDNRLRYGLAFVEDVQLLKGDGQGQNLTGIKPQAADYAVPVGLAGFAAPTMVDKLRIAQLQVALALYPADGQVLHPDRLGCNRDAEGRRGPLPHRQPAGHDRADPLGAARGVLHGSDGRRVHGRRVAHGRPALRPRAVRRAGLHRRRRQLPAQHGDDPRRGAPRPDRLPAGSLRRRRLRQRLMQMKGAGFRVRPRPREGRSMAEKQTYTVHRSMIGDGRDYNRGDTREMAPADAAEMIVSGALSEEGKGPLVREPSVRHTFGAEPSAVNDAGYTTPTGEGVVTDRPAVDQVAVPAKVGKKA